MTTPAHRARIWKSGNVWIARRPRIDDGWLDIERAYHDTWDEACDWVSQCWPDVDWLVGLRAAVGDGIASVAAPLRRGFQQIAEALQGEPTRDDYALGADS